MGLRDFIRKKNELSKGDGAAAAEETVRRINGPEFTFIRSDTLTQEILEPPGAPPGDASSARLSAKAPSSSSSRAHRSLDVFRSSRSRSASASSQGSTGGGGGGGSGSKKDGPRLSQRLHLKRAPDTSDSVPRDLPEIVVAADDGGGGEDDDGAQGREGQESQWEQRATILAGQNERARSRPTSPAPGDGGAWQGEGGGGGGAAAAAAAAAGSLAQHRTGAGGAVSSKQIDADIQLAIRLHEEGDLEHSTELFGRLADPQGVNNPLSQVLYGLALRHGWGCTPDPERAVHYLSAAASNSASVEQLALQAGLKKGGAAKGELVLAIFELANCFRHGWGIREDPVAAKQYYETAANLGDTDAMNEVAWCYLEGYGCKKDKFAAARYYRLAETSGNKTLGNTWIWKEKYDPPGEGGSSSKKK